MLFHCSYRKVFRVVHVYDRKQVEIDSLSVALKKKILQKPLMQKHKSYFYFDIECKRKENPQRGSKQELFFYFCRTKGF